MVATTRPQWSWRVIIALGFIAVSLVGVSLCVPVVCGEDPSDTSRDRDGAYPKTREPAIGLPARRTFGTAIGAPGGDLMAFHSETPDGKQQTTVIDGRSRTMAIYHVDPRTGAIALKSVRNLGWDLQIDDYNSGTPSTREIRELVERK